MKKHKVIVVGLQRTGTTTLGEALLMLGYNVVGTLPELSKYLLEDQVSHVLKVSEQYDAYQDLPWLFLFKELDKKYPNSKFILTTRDKDEWLKSMIEHFGHSNTKMREWAYGKGCPKGNEDLYLEKFEKQHNDVLSYFRNRSEDLLILNLKSDFNWEKLCKFLNKPIPSKKFPHSNKSSYSYTLKDKLLDCLRSLTPDLLRKLRVDILVKLGKHHGPNRFK